MTSGQVTKSLSDRVVALLRDEAAADLHKAETWGARGRLRGGLSEAAAARAHKYASFRLSEIIRKIESGDY